jgi:hypothetical protein
MSSLGAWLAGAIVGVAAGTASLVFPTLGWALGAAFVLGALLSAQRLAAIGGELIGFGSAWIVLIRLADDRCQASASVPGQGCTGPDTSAWYLVGGVLVAAGIALTIAAVAWSRRRQRGPRAQESTRRECCGGRPDDR